MYSQGEQETLTATWGTVSVYRVIQSILDYALYTRLYIDNGHVPGPETVRRSSQGLELSSGIVIFYKETKITESGRAGDSYRHLGNCVFV